MSSALQESPSQVRRASFSLDIVRCQNGGALKSQTSGATTSEALRPSDVAPPTRVDTLPQQGAFRLLIRHARIDSACSQPPHSLRMTGRTFTRPRSPMLVLLPPVPRAKSHGKSKSSVRYTCGIALGNIADTAG